MTIRRFPEDFIVEERLTPEVEAAVEAVWSPRTPFAVYRIIKTSLTTPEAEHRLAKVLGVRTGDVTHAGLKDKHARTTQHLSVRVKAGADHAGPESMSLPGMEARRIGWTGAAADSGWIDANVFTIVVRGLTRKQCNEMARRAALLDAAAVAGSPSSVPALLLVHYFGEQRFGSARHGEGFIAERLVKGDFEGALRLAIGTPARKDSGSRRALTRAAATHWGDWTAAVKHAPASPLRKPLETLAAGGSFVQAFTELPFIEQRMAVDSFQSHLWNRTAAALARQVDESGSSIANGEGADHALVFPRALSVSQAWCELVVPLPSPEVRGVTPWIAPMEAAAAAHGVTLAGLRIAGLRRPVFGTGRRSLFCTARGFMMSPPEKDEAASPRSPANLKTTLRFELPSGSYATVLLAALGEG